MARYKGTFQNPANYEPLIAAPFDARALVETKSDLTAAKTWQQSNGEVWIYSGMIVSVASDVNTDNNGVYMLRDARKYTEESAWVKMAQTEDIGALQTGIEDLQEQVNDLQVSGGGSLDVVVDTETDLPEIGNKNTTYYVLENKSIYRWQEETQSYISFGGGEPADLEINMIYGGDANGTN